MGQTPPHLKTLEEIERDCIPGLVQVLREESPEAVRYFLWDMTGWHRDYDPCLWRNRATDEQKRAGWEMWVRMDKKDPLHGAARGPRAPGGGDDGRPGRRAGGAVPELPVPRLSRRRLVNA